MECEGIEDYLSEQKKCELKIGDVVKITRKAETYENGWNNAWVTPNMNRYVNQIHKINIITDVGIFLEDCANFAFPYFILKKVSPKK